MQAEVMRGSSTSFSKRIKERVITAESELASIQEEGRILAAILACGKTK
jgi:hypothetical protein